MTDSGIVDRLKQYIWLLSLPKFQSIENPKTWLFVLVLVLSLKDGDRNRWYRNDYDYEHEQEKDRTDVGKTAARLITDFF